MRVVICHKEFGIYLGSCMGLGFWTKLDPAGQDSAVTFREEAEAQAIIKTWDDQPAQDLLSFPEVETEGRGYATIEECVVAGLERWDPHAIPDLPKRPSRRDATTSDLGRGRALPTATKDGRYEHRGVPATHAAMRELFEQEQVEDPHPGYDCGGQCVVHMFPRLKLRNTRDGD